MQTLADRRDAQSLDGATWLAAALSAGASLLHWIATDSDTHNWSGDTVVSLVAGAALMALAIALMARPWNVRTARAMYLIGAVATAGVVIAFLLSLLLAQPSTPGHVGHDVHGEHIATVDAIRTTVEVALIGVLLWKLRLTGQPHAGGH